MMARSFMGEGYGEVFFGIISVIVARIWCKFMLGENNWRYLAPK